MQARYRQDGKAIDYTPAGVVASGAVIKLATGLLGMAHRSIGANELGALSMTAGVYEVVKAQEVLALWTALYWDEDGNPYGGTAGSGCLTATSTGNTFYGWAIVAAGANDKTVTVLRWPATTVTIHESLANPIADPGNAQAIPITNSGAVDIVTAGAETRTIAAPSFRGQMLSLSMKTDGGDCVVTVATLINQTGNNTITFNDAGDSILLVAIQNGANLRWRVAYNDGCTLSTV